MKNKNRKLTLLVAIVLGGAVAATLASYKFIFSPRWKTFASQSGAFSVLMPGTPGASQTQAPAGGARVPVDIVSSEAKNGASYLCTYIDYPSTPEPNTAFDATRDRSIRAVQGRIVSERTLTIGGNPAREFQAELPSHDVIDQRYVVAGQRLFMLVVVSKAGARNTADIDKFFNSLRLNTKHL